MAMDLTNRFPIAEPRIIGFQKFLVDFKFLLLEQMLQIRVTWYWHVLFGLVLPVALVFGFGRIGSGTQDRASLLYVISGAAIFAVANDGLYKMATRIAIMRKEGIMLYYASLPISRFALMSALLVSRLVITLPGMLVPIVFGMAIYNVQFEFSPWIVVLLPLTALVLSALGMALGVLIENLEMIQMVTNMLVFLLVMGAPVFIPMSALPVPLQVIGLLLPPTYAAAALRMALSGNINGEFFLYMAILAAMLPVSFGLLNRWLTWRVK
jgi:ABC-2 type transport system permease protein